MPEMYRLLKRHNMRISRIDDACDGYSPSFVLMVAENGLEWRHCFRYRREAYAKAQSLIDATLTSNKDEAE